MTQGDTSSGKEDVEILAIEAGLELERRLYESAEASVSVTFGKESLLVTFLTSGSLVAIAAAMQAFAEVASLLDPLAAMTGLALMGLAVVALFISLLMLGEILRGRDVGELTGSQDFLDIITDVNRTSPATRKDVLLQLASEYQKARTNLSTLVKDRMSRLFQALGILALSVGLALVGVFVALVNATISSEKAIAGKPKLEQKEGTVTTAQNFPMAPNVPGKPKPASREENLAYPRDVAKGSKNDQTASVEPKPKPQGTIKLPPAGPGTVMTKGGGK